MTNVEAIKMLRLMKYKYLIQIGSIFDTALDMAIEALEREPSEDGTLEVKVEDATKIGRVLISDDKHRGGLYYPDEDEPKGDDLISRAEAIKSLNGEVAVMGKANKDEVVSYIKTIMMRIKDLPSADRPRDGDLISRADAIEAMGEEPPVWCDEEYEIAERDQWRADVEAIKSVPSADRPRGEWTTDEVAELLANIFGDECACNWNRNDEWLPEVCKYAETTCPSPKEANGCWKQFLIQGGARRK